MEEKDILKNISEFYVIKLLNIFQERSAEAAKAISLIGQKLTSLFNYIEPAHFRKKIIIVKELADKFILPVEEGKIITLNKEILFKINKDFVIQLFDNNNLYLWDKFDYSTIVSNKNTIIYKFESNREIFIAKENEIDVTECPSGSRFSNEFCELQTFLNKYKEYKIKKSSCPIFNNSWFDKNRIFFKCGGKDIPESYMQKSLKNFLDDINAFKGDVGQFEANREHTLGAEKPVDIKINWGKSNRMALIEIKWLGKSKGKKITSTHNNSRANEGYRQLKNYYELAKRDYPNKIIKCYLIVIDGRRWQTNESTVTISYTNGMHYETKELKIDADIQYWKTHPNYEKPIRMFVEPICEM